MSDETELTTYPFSEPDRLSVDPGYAAAREREGLTRAQLPYGSPTWLLTRYDDVKSMLGDPRFSREAVVGEDEPRFMPYVHRSDALTTMDPPRHTRLRRVVSRAFSSRRIETLRPRTQRIVDDLLDAMERAPAPVDLMESFALQVPMAVICELLGVPFDDRERFHEWSAVLASTATSGVDVDVLMRANEDLRAYLADLVEQRRREPAEDLLTVLVEARDTEDRLTEDEMISLAWSVLLAGYEITAYQIGNFVHTLLTHPDLAARLSKHPEDVAPAVEELLRHIPLTSSAFFPRRATEDVELGGTLVRAGEAVLPSMMSANRDETAFPDAARIDFDRAPDVQHLSFSYGIHHCLGAQLARMELQVVTGTLFRRFPELRLAVPAEEVPWREGAILRGPIRLPVTW
ncbi:cytochrome P450 [Streptomyces sp. NBRC 109706]|uniref:cytochrome P450 n=1 Tax=Streptomyces sp. NBRC 109706 TaxID=1550035 RepID=UPI000785276D|nr:cytochrome P450 [Streptomyces sp. NBRC 109706]